MSQLYPPTVNRDACEYSKIIMLGVYFARCVHVVDYLTGDNVGRTQAVRALLTGAEGRGYLQHALNNLIS